jgi:hypothetical protein
MEALFEENGLPYPDVQSSSSLSRLSTLKTFKDDHEEEHRCLNNRRVVS